jgi:thiamine-monophosphate kinase
MTGEFQTIAELLAPLAHPEWARGLSDDVAVLPSRPGHDLVLTKDALVEGVHFLAGDPLDTVAQKLLRVNLSDLAAKGADPFGYLLACAWSARCGWSEREAFVLGLARDQSAFNVMLLGGDTVSTPGPVSFSATMLGWAPKGSVVGRGGARAGDRVFVTGRIGDGYLGLLAATGKLRLDPQRLDTLIEHYRRPQPQLAFSNTIREFATASVDVSDGLVADLGHIAATSAARIVIDLERLPVSMAAQTWLEDRVDLQDSLLQLATGGDDYEIAFSVRQGDEARLRQRAEQARVRVTAIGEVVQGDGIEVRFNAVPMRVGTSGWSHD